MDLEPAGKKDFFHPFVRRKNNTEKKVRYRHQKMDKNVQLSVQSTTLSNGCQERPHTYKSRAKMFYPSNSCAGKVDCF